MVQTKIRKTPNRMPKAKQRRSPNSRSYVVSGVSARRRLSRAEFLKKLKGAELERSNRTLGLLAELSKGRVARCKQVFNLLDDATQSLADVSKERKKNTCEFKKKLASDVSSILTTPI